MLPSECPPSDVDCVVLLPSRPRGREPTVRSFDREAQPLAPVIKGSVNLCSRNVQNRVPCGRPPGSAGTGLPTAALSGRAAFSAKPRLADAALPPHLPAPPAGDRLVRKGHLAVLGSQRRLRAGRARAPAHEASAAPCRSRRQPLGRRLHPGQERAGIAPEPVSARSRTCSATASRAAAARAGIRRRVIPVSRPARAAPRPMRCGPRALRGSSGRSRSARMTACGPAVMQGRRESGKAAMSRRALLAKCNRGLRTPLRGMAPSAADFPAEGYVSPGGRFAEHSKTRQNAQSETEAVNASF